MIILKLLFYANIRNDFGEEQIVNVQEHHITIIELFQLFHSKTNQRADQYFLDKGGERLKENMVILINGRNIKALNELMTVITESCEISFFPLIAGG